MLLKLVIFIFNNEIDFNSILYDYCFYQKITKMMKFILLLFIFLSWSSFAQYGISAGLNTLKGFGVDKTFVGFNLGVELPRDYETSLYLKASFYAKGKSIPSSGSAVNLEPLDPNNFNLGFVDVIENTYNYTTIEGGVRYYLFDGYDNGFALYGGSNVMGIINRGKRRFSDYDETQYRLPLNEKDNGTILALALGFSGGAKYTVPAVGTFFMEASGDYIVIPMASNEAMQQISQSFYSPLLFAFTIGFRKDFY